MAGPRKHGTRFSVASNRSMIEPILTRRPAMRARLAARNPVDGRGVLAGSLADWLRVCSDVARDMLAFFKVAGSRWPCL